MAGHIASAGKSDWRTPERILEPVRSLFKYGIHLDPCASSLKGIGAEVDYMLPANGLEKPWDGTVFVNPPFGTTWVKGSECLTPKEVKARIAAGKHEPTWREQKLSQWVEKAWGHYLDGDAETVLLLPAAVDTKWWQNLILPCAAGICFIEGRVRFEGAAQGAPMACALVYFGDLGPRFKRVFATLGFCA